jgi:hypothetical protein
VYLPSRNQYEVIQDLQSYKYDNSYSRTNFEKRGIIFSIFMGATLSPLGTAATTGLLYQPQIINDGECGAIGGMEFGRENRSTLRKPAPAPLCPKEIPHDLNRARTRIIMVGIQQITA